MLRTLVAAAKIDTNLVVLDRQIALVMVDGPQGFKSSVPAIVAATSPAISEMARP